METLILGRPCADRSDVVRRLVAHGANVHTCHDDAWGCAGLHDACPLDTIPVDAAVAIAPPGSVLDPQGAACALRARVPLVTVGGLEGDPVNELADVDLRSADESIGPVVESTARAGARHRRAVEEAAPTFLRDGEELVVDVNRTATTIHLTIGGSFDDERVGPIADHVREAIRRFDPHASVVDVSVSRSPEA